MLPALLVAAATIIPPGHEADVAALFADAALPAGCVAGDLRIESDRVVTALACEGGRKLALELVHPTKSPEAPRTSNFAVIVKGEPELAAAIAAVIGPRDNSTIWEKPVAPAAPLMPPAARYAVAAFLAAWPCAELVRVLRQRRRTTR